MAGRGRALLGFASFGWFWGTFGASLPAVKTHADVSEGALGIALLFVGVGALALMRPMGALVDRYGRRLLPASMLVFAGTALLLAAAGSVLTLGAALLLLGAASGSDSAPPVGSVMTGRVLSLGRSFRSTKQFRPNAPVVLARPARSRVA